MTGELPGKVALEITSLSQFSPCPLLHLVPSYDLIQHVVVQTSMTTDVKYSSFRAENIGKSSDKKVIKSYSHLDCLLASL